MRSFDYARAAARADATAAAAAGAVIIAGGTNLLDLMKLEVMVPDRLVDINRLDLGDIERPDDSSVRIGALVRNSDLAADPMIRRDYPLLSRALLAGGSSKPKRPARPDKSGPRARLQDESLVLEMGKTMADALDEQGINHQAEILWLG